MIIESTNYPGLLLNLESGAMYCTLTKIGMKQIIRNGGFSLQDVHFNIPEDYDGR